MRNYRQIVYIAITVCVVSMCAACGETAKEWNPSFVSLTPSLQEGSGNVAGGTEGNTAQGGSGTENNVAQGGNGSGTEGNTVQGGNGSGGTENNAAQGGSGSNGTESNEGQAGGSGANGSAGNTNLTLVPTSALTPTDTPTPTLTPTPVPEATPTTAPEFGRDEMNAADFFQNMVFAGDSVLSHFYWKVPFYEKELFGGSDFLVAVSYSAREALKPGSELHPMYKGEQRPLWESMQLIEPKRVATFFGLNDIGVNGVDGFLENYKKLLGNIKEAVPDVKFYIISITPMRADCEKESGLNNKKIAEANEKLKVYCEENDIGYIDVATQLTDANGAIKDEYSDGTNVHQTKAAYELWRNAMVEYAKDVLYEEYLESLR